MSNVKSPPAWLSANAADAVIAGLDRVTATDVWCRLGLSAREIVALERIAAVKSMSPEACGGDLIRVAMKAIKLGGWDADAV